MFSYHIGAVCMAIYEYRCVMSIMIYGTGSQPCSLNMERIM